MFKTISKKEMFCDKLCAPQLAQKTDNSYNTEYQYTCSFAFTGETFVWKERLESHIKNICIHK